MGIFEKRVSCAVAVAVIWVALNGDSFAQDVTIIVESDKQATTEVKPAEKRPFVGVRAAVDVAILLDTSNSMDGLIDQARSQLWTIVQQFARAEKDGKTPKLRVAVFEYGNSGLPAAEDYIRQVSGLTDDLDQVSEALFSLKTNGGDEYCGAIIAAALQRLDWSDEDNSYKAIFIAGNEPFTQGSADYRDSCKSAIEKGVVVNTIHCGNYQTGISTKWKDGADLAEGEYMNIDQDRKVVHIESPHDDVIVRLNAKLNETYLWYGDRVTRKRMHENQMQQDANASGAGAASATNRAATKSGRMYKFKNHDLVDRVDMDMSMDMSMGQAMEVLDEVDESELPEKLQQMSPEDRAKHVKKMADDRRRIQAEIAQATAERDKFVAAKQKEMAASGGEATLGDAMSAAVGRQLKAAGFQLTND